MEHEEWKESVGIETNAMIINDTWYEAGLPKGKRAVTSRSSQSSTMLMGQYKGTRQD